MSLSRLFESERVRLSAIRPEDSALVARWYDDSTFVRHLDGTPAYPRTERDVSRFIESANGKDTFIFGIRLLSNDDLIGFVTLDGILWSHGVAWLSIGIADAYQGQGYGAEALTLLLDFGFQELNLHRVQLTVFAYNERAIGLYERLGFVREGSHREALHRDGRRWDMYLYGILRREWEARDREV